MGLPQSARFALLVAALATVWNLMPSNSAKWASAGSPGPAFSPAVGVFKTSCLAPLNVSLASVRYSLPRIDDPDAESRLRHPWDLPALSVPRPTAPDGKSRYNVAVVIIDAVSRAEIMAYMPKTRNFLLSTLNDPSLVSVPSDHAIAIDSATAPHVTALLSGRAYTRPSDNAPDITDWLHEELRELAGYKVGYFVCDNIISHAFEARYPSVVDDLMRDVAAEETCTAAAPEGFRVMSSLALCDDRTKGLCLKNGQPERFEANYVIGGLSKFWKRNADVPKLTVTHLSSAHVPNRPETANLFDGSVADLLAALTSSSDTIVLFMTDHGAFQDNYSYRFPLEHWLLPAAAVSAAQREALTSNSDKMTTAYDIYHTLREALGLPPKDPEPGLMGASLLSAALPEDRTCADVGSPPHICACNMNDWVAETDDQTLDLLKKEIESVLNSERVAGLADASEADQACPPITVETLKARYIQTHYEVEVLTNYQRRFEYQGHVKLLPSRGVLSTMMASIKQKTAYAPDEECARAKGGNPEFCLCSRTNGVELA